MTFPRISGGLSYVSIRIHLVKALEDRAINLAEATGFLWLYDGRTFLISNCHNFSGWDHVRSKAMSDTGAFPTEVHYQLTLKVKQDGDQVYMTRKTLVTNLLHENDSPQWLVHPAHGADVDVAALDLGEVLVSRFWPDLPEAKILTTPLNGYHDFGDFYVSAGDDAYVIGYPLGLHGGFNFPIWKRASIASEPGLTIDDLPKTLVDTATRPGMSGSPVIAVRRGYIASRDGDRAKDISGQAETFLGVYSGRVDDDPLGANLGIVWKADVVDEIVRGGTRGTRPWDKP